MFAERDVKRLQVFLYLIPVLGVVPAIITLYRDGRSQAKLDASRLAIKLAFIWFVGTVLLNTGAAASESLHVSFLVSSTLLTSGYFITNCWLMLQVLRRKRLRFPGLTK